MITILTGSRSYIKTILSTTGSVINRKGVTGEMNVAFVVRLTWESLSQNWRIQLTPVNGDEARLFGDAESLFLYIDRQMIAVTENTLAHCPKEDTK
jgi:hypothetical protein